MNASATLPSLNSTPPFTSFKSLLGAMKRIAALSVGSVSPSPDSVSLATYLLSNLREADLLPQRITPGTKGGIALVFLEGRRYADIECGNDGEVAVSMLDREHINNSFSINVKHGDGGVTTEGAIERLVNFLRG